MQLVHQQAVGQMEKLFSELGGMKRDAALEIGCGDCLVSKDLLEKHFAQIDLLDQCQEAVKEMRSYQGRCERVRHLFHMPMQDLDTQLKYNCIVLRYCIGYLDDEQAARFLRKLGAMLCQETQKARAASSSSFIIIQDQVIPDGVEEYTSQDQRLRKWSSFQRIIKAAGLAIFKKSALEELNSRVWPVTAMALTPT